MCGGQGIDNMSKGLEIRGQQRRLRPCYDWPEELATTTEASAEEDEPKVSMTTTEASAKKAEETTRPSERLRRRRRQYVYGLRVFTTTTVSLAE